MHSSSARDGSIFFPRHHGGRNSPAAYLETLKRTELLANTYVVKRFGGKYDFMAHAHLVMWLVFLDNSVLNSNRIFQTRGIGAVIDFYLVYIPYSKCLVYVL